MGFLPSVVRLLSDWSFLRKYIKGARRFNQITKQISDARLAEDESNKNNDIVATLLRAKEPESGGILTIPDIQSETGLLVFAGNNAVNPHNLLFQTLNPSEGSDTSRVGIMGTLFYTAHSPQLLVRLQSEIRSAFSSLDEIKVGPTLQSCRFLHACVDESLRLTPPVGGVLTRQVLPGGLEFEGRYFPTGTEIATPIYALHHQELYHPEAFEFKPSRWIVGQDVLDTDVARSQSAFYPFGYGPRACIGRSLAYAEMTILLARLLFEFDIRLSETVQTKHRHNFDGRGEIHKNELQVFDSVIAITDGPMLEFKVRE